MSKRVKTMLMMFLDYGLCLLLSLLTLAVFAMLFKFTWANITFSTLVCLAMFGLVYSRSHRAAKSDMLYKVERSWYEGLMLVLPLAVLNFVLALAFTLIQIDLVPVRDIVVDISYSFPDNAPRVANEILLIDAITPVVRLWFAPIIGYMRESTPGALLFVVPLINLVGGFLGYIAGQKKFFLSDYIFVAKEKVKEKFNE